MVAASRFERDGRKTMEVQVLPGVPTIPDEP